MQDIIKDPQVLEAFKIRYEKASEKGEEIFEFRQQNFVLGYAKYLIEFAEMKRN